MHRRSVRPDRRERTCSLPGDELMTWAFVLEELESGHTRLIVRARGGRDYHFLCFPHWIAKHLVRSGHFIIQRKQLLGIAKRAEASGA